MIATTIGMFLTETVLFASALLLSALPKTYFDVYRVARNGFERPFLLAAAAAVAASVAGARKIWSQKEIGA